MVKGRRNAFHFDIPIMDPSWYLDLPGTMIHMEAVAPTFRQTNIFVRFVIGNKVMNMAVFSRTLLFICSFISMLWIEVLSWAMHGYICINIRPNSNCCCGVLETQLSIFHC